MTYSEQVRHPSGALERRRDGSRKKIWFWILVGVAAFIYLIWRAGLHSGGSGASAIGAAGPANPHGWV